MLMGQAKENNIPFVKVEYAAVVGIDCLGLSIQRYTFETFSE